jgi:hypothetical protein
MGSSSKSEVLRKAILDEYKSVRQFAVHMNIPYSTLVTALERGVDGMAHNPVLRICSELSLNPVDFSPLSGDNDLSRQIVAGSVMEKYERFNKAGRRKILEIMDDYAQIAAYTTDEE